MINAIINEFRNNIHYEITQVPIQEFHRIGSYLETLTNCKMSKLGSGWALAQKWVSLEYMSVKLLRGTPLFYTILFDCDHIFGCFKKGIINIFENYHVDC